MNLTVSDIIEIRRFNTYISNKHIIYRGAIWNGKDDDKEVGLFPVLPLVELTKMEATILVILAVMLNGSFVMLFEYFNWYPCNRNQDGSINRTLLDVIFITPLVMVIMGTITLVYKYIVKK